MLNSSDKGAVLQSALLWPNCGSQIELATIIETFLCADEAMLSSVLGNSRHSWSDVLMQKLLSIRKPNWHSSAVAGLACMQPRVKTNPV